jgi:Icc-related predicted phosphoesterase
MWGSLEGPAWPHIERAVRRQYARLFEAMPAPAYLTYGNVDIPQMWGDYLRDGHQVLDGEVVEIGGRTFGFVGGGLRTEYRTPYELDDEAYAEKVVAVGKVDVLCCHIPPAVPELLYDTVARRFERGSEAVLRAIRETQPHYVLFGHVHQPLARRVRIGRTECINVGHFRASGMPYVLSW